MFIEMKLIYVNLVKHTCTLTLSMNVFYLYVREEVSSNGRQKNTRIL